jgi:hypothetical protein
LEALSGCTVCTEKTATDPPVTREASNFEARIVDLFLPWLKDDIPDGAWMVLSGNVERIIKEVRNYGPGNSRTTF